MKRLFLVEASTEYDSLFCYELREGADGHTYDKEGLRVYTQRQPSAMFNNVDREQFFGNLNSLCRTKWKPNAPPMELAPPNLPSAGPMAETVDRVMADMEHAGISDGEADNG